MTTKPPSEMPPGYDEMLTNIKGLVEGFCGIQQRGIAQYTPVVERIISTHSRDAAYIQHTLNHLMDFACHPEGLALFKTLCRYYYTLDPVATVGYVDFYREMWDTEETVA